MVPQQLVRRASMAALVMVATMVMACSEKKDGDDRVQPDTESQAAGGTAGAVAVPATPLTPETQQAIDAGNAAYRAKDYALALTEFEKAATLSPKLPAPWFGIYMVAQVRKDTKAADVALAEIRKRNAAPALEQSDPKVAARNEAPTKTGTGVTKN